MKIPDSRDKLRMPEDETIGEITIGKDIGVG